MNTDENMVARATNLGGLGMTYGLRNYHMIVTMPRLAIGRTLIWPQMLPFSMFIWDATLQGIALTGHLHCTALIRAKEWKKGVSPAPAHNAFTVVASVPRSLRRGLTTALGQGAKLLFVRYLGFTSYKGRLSRPRFVVKGVRDERAKEILRDAEIPQSLWPKF
jgi:hypothetical protein